MHLFRNAALVVAASACLACSARASITYSYVDTTSTSGGVTTVNVFLSEALTGSSTSFIQANNGLFGAGFGIDVTNGGNATITAGTFNTQPIVFPYTTAANPASGFGPNGPGNTFNNQPSSTGQTNAAISESIGASDPHGFGTPNQVITNTSGTTNLYFLGTFTINAGTTDTTFELTDLNRSPNPALGNGNTGVTITQVGAHDLDFTDDNGVLPAGTYTGADNFTSTFTVAAVPEPNGLVLSGIAACCVLPCLGYAGYRRRKAQLLKVDAAA